MVKQIAGMAMGGLGLLRLGGLRFCGKEVEGAVFGNQQTLWEQISSLCGIQIQLLHMAFYNWHEGDIMLQSYPAAKTS